MPDLVPRGPDAPSYGPTPQVAPSQLPNARMDPNMPLAAAGGGQEVARTFGASQELADAGVKLGEMEQERQYQIQETQGIAKATTLANTLHAKAMSARGENAFGIRDSINEEFKQGISDIGKDMPPAVQVRFARHVNRIAGHLDGTLAMHEMGESQRVDNESSDQLIQANMDKAKLNWQRWNDPDSENGTNPVDESAADVIGATRQWATRNGVTKTVADAHAAKMVARLYGGVITSMLDNQQDQVAAQAFKKYSDGGLLDGDPNLKDQLAKRMDRDTKLGDAQRVTDRVFTNYLDWSTQQEHKVPETIDAAMDEARQLAKGYDPETRKLIESQVKERWQEKKVAEEDASNKAFSSAMDQIRKGSKFDDIKQSELWDQLDERGKEHLEMVAARVAKRESPYAALDNPAVLNNLMLMSDKDIADLGKYDPDKFNAFMAHLVPNVTEPTYKAFLSRIKGEDRRAEKPVSFSLNEREKEDLFAKLNLSGVLDKAKNAKNVADLKRKTQDAQSEFTNHAAEFERRIQDEFVTPEHRLPTGEEFRKMRDKYVIDELMKKPQAYPWLFGKVPAWVPTPFSKDVSPEEKVEALRRAGIIQMSPTNATLRNATPTSEKKR